MGIRVRGRLVVEYLDGDNPERLIVIDATGIEVGDEEVSDPGRGMGPETVVQAETQHDLLGTLTWAIYQYPAGVLNYEERPNIPHRVLEWPQYEVYLD